MDKDLDIRIEESLKAYRASGVEEQVNYQKFYLYSIVTHSTAIEGSTVTEIENQLLFDEGIPAKGRSLSEQMMNVDLKEVKGEYIQSLVDSRENDDSTIAQDIMLRHHISNLNHRVSQYQEIDTVNSQFDTVNDTVNSRNDTVKELKEGLKRIYMAIRENPDITHSELMNIFNISESTAKRATQELKKLGFIKRIGSDKTGRWVIIK